MSGYSRIAIGVFMMLVFCSVESRLHGQPSQSPTGLLMQSMFSPLQAPPHKTMGLAQRSFLDLVEASKQQLEIAFVVDGTESMGESIDGMRNAIDKMVADLQRYKGLNVKFQLVVFRDCGPDGANEVLLPLSVSNNSFVAPEDLKAALTNLKAESGAPYFPELIDLGIHTALTELNWTRAQETTRWLMVFGDAPPYENGFSDAETNARRRIATDQLVSLANRADIAINCVLCTSRERERAAYETVLDETRRFMSTLSTETGGLMVDLSYDDIRKAIEGTLQEHPVGYQQIEDITASDVAEAIRQAQQVEQQRRTRLAVLPHMPIEQMSFDADREEVRVAAELRHKFRTIEGMDVKSPLVVKRLFSALKGRGLSDQQLRQTLANGLNVDYIVWGEVQRPSAAANTIKVVSAIYSRTTGQSVVSTVAQSNLNAKPAENVTGDLAKQLMTRAVSESSDARLANAFRSIAMQEQRAQTLLRPVSTLPNSRDLILSGFESLEQALAYPVGSGEGDSLLAKAESALQRAVDPTDGEYRNALAQLLLANCYFNQARSLEGKGRTDLAKQKTQAYVTALNVANSIKRTAYPNLQTEIQADHTLFIRKDIPAAVKLYRQLAGMDQQADTNIHSALRAHWMLAGIYSGDWGVGAEAVDAEKARYHLIQILANWSDSPEAQFIRRNLRWDEEQGKMQYPHFPKQYENVSRLIES